MHIIFLLGNLKGKDHLEDLDKDGRITLEWILKKQSVDCEVDSFGSGQGPLAGSCEHGNEHLGPMNDGEFD
jgi:hypothetical protein